MRQEGESAHQFFLGVPFRYLYLPPVSWSMYNVRIPDWIQYPFPQIRLLPQTSGIPFLRNGLYLGEIKKDRFEPGQSFAMALRREDYPWTISLPWEDERVKRYLRGETIEIMPGEAVRENGWQLICVNGYPLGWGKLVDGVLKNKYHAGWRMK